MSKKLVLILLAISLLALPVVGCTAKPSLSLVITEPRDGATIDTSPVKVGGYVTDPKATVWVGGTKVTVSNKGYYSTNVELAEGENTIKVTAAQGKEGKWKNVVDETVTVTYSPK